MRERRVSVWRGEFDRGRGRHSPVAGRVRAAAASDPSEWLSVAAGRWCKPLTSWREIGAGSRAEFGGRRSRCAAQCPSCHAADVCVGCGHAGSLHGPQHAPKTRAAVGAHSMWRGDGERSKPDLRARVWRMRTSLHGLFSPGFAPEWERGDRCDAEVRGRNQGQAAGRETRLAS